MSIPEPLHDERPPIVRRLLVIVDQPITRLGLDAAISLVDALSVCGDAASAESALKALDESKPDVVLIDLKEGALALARQMLKKLPRLMVLLLATHSEPVFALKTRNAGVQACVAKEDEMEVIVTALRAVLAGNTFLSPRLQGCSHSDIDPRVHSLSPTQFTVFKLIAELLPTATIAARMGLSIKTVETHRFHIRKKLGMTNGEAVVRYAVEWRALHLPDPPEAE